MHARNCHDHKHDVGYGPAPYLLTRYGVVGFIKEILDRLPCKGRARSRIAY